MQHFLHHIKWIEIYSIIKPVKKCCSTSFLKTKTKYKNHTHMKKVGVNLRISFWHLLINLKNKLLLKKLLKWTNKNKIILIFTMLHFLKKYKEKCLYISLWKSWWYDLHFLRFRAKHTEIGCFRSFFTLLPPEDSKT